MHPNHAALVAFCDAEAGPARQQRIARHLAKCRKCQAHLEHIESEKNLLAAAAATGAPEDLRPGLAGLIHSMTAWREGRTAVLASAVKSRVREQLELYLGPRAVAMVERPGMRAEELLAESGQILNALLGPAAAEAVRDDVLGGLDCADAAADTHRSAAETHR